MAWPTSDTFELSHYAVAGLSKIFRKDLRYMKCGVEMTDLIAEGTQTEELFEPEGKSRSQSIMTAMDKLNQKMGRGTISFAGSGLQKEWFTKRDLRSPRYTTHFSELLIAHAD